MTVGIATVDGFAQTVDMKFYLARYKDALSVRYMEAPQDWIMTVVSVTEVVPARDGITSLCIEADIKRETRSFCCVPPIDETVKYIALDITQKVFSIVRG
jgi:hypothetical protein